MDTKSGVAWTLLFTPIVTGMVTSFSVGSMSSAAESVKSRPPGWVFSVVWPVIYLLIGYAWAIMFKEGTLINVFMGTLTASLVAWIIVYTQGSKKAGLYVILVSLLISLMVWSYTLKESKISYTPYLIVPLVSWLVFATMLNFEEVNNLK